MFLKLLHKSLERVTIEQMFLVIVLQSTVIMMTL